MRWAMRRGIESPVLPHMLQLNGVSTPGAASPTLSVDQCACEGPGSWSVSQSSPAITALLHDLLVGVVPDALAGPVAHSSSVVCPADHAVVGRGVRPGRDRRDRDRLACEAVVLARVVLRADRLLHGGMDPGV